jgi:hypothetical protein
MKFETPWNGAPLHYDQSECLKAFEKKVLGLVRREFAYRRLAADLLQELKALENFVPPTTSGLLKDANEVWRKQLDDIANL